MSRRVHALMVLSGVLWMAPPPVAFAQTNPLYEHRRVASGGASAKSLLEASVVTHVTDGRTTLGTASSRLIDAGVQSGDQLIVDVGTLSLNVHVAFRDERERAANYYAATHESVPFDPTVTLLIDRENPAQPVVLDTTAGGASMYLGAAPGAVASLRTARAHSPARRTE